MNEADYPGFDRKILLYSSERFHALPSGNLLVPPQPSIAVPSRNLAKHLSSLTALPFLSLFLSHIPPARASPHIWPGFVSTQDKLWSDTKGHLPSILPGLKNMEAVNTRVHTSLFWKVTASGYEEFSRQAALNNAPSEMVLLTDNNSHPPLWPSDSYRRDEILENTDKKHYLPSLSQDVSTFSPDDPKVFHTIPRDMGFLWISQYSLCHRRRLSGQPSAPCAALWQSAPVLHVFSCFLSFHNSSSP